MILLLSAAYAADAPTRDADQTLSGDLDKGEAIDNEWATKSAVACFPGTKMKYFTGNTIIHKVAQAPSRDIVLKLTPTAGQDLAFYVLQLGGVEKGQTPPNVRQAWRCHVAHYAGAGAPEIKKIEGYKNDYELVVGVVGKGAYSLEVWDEQGRQW